MSRVARRFRGDSLRVPSFRFDWRAFTLVFHSDATLPDTSKLQGVFEQTKAEK
jgi:hypothetical protein